MIDWTDEELKERIRAKAGNETYPVWLAELNRRAQERSSRASEDLASESLRATKALSRISMYLAAATVLLAFGTLIVAFSETSTNPLVVVLSGVMALVLLLGIGREDAGLRPPK